MTSISQQLKDLWLKNRGFILFIVLIILFRVSIADQYHVPSGSMLPTIVIGDRILVNKLAYNIKVPFTNIVLFQPGEPQRGDIIVFEQPKEGTVMVKRLIGLPGDRITVKAGYFYLNGRPLMSTDERLKRPLQESLNEFELFSESLDEQKYTIRRMPRRIHFQKEEFEVPQGHYFVAGDNRDNSNDSRAWGTVPRDLLKGKAFRVFYSLKFDGFIPKFTWSRTGASLYKHPVKTSL